MADEELQDELEMGDEKADIVPPIDPETGDVIGGDVIGTPGLEEDDDEEDDEDALPEDEEIAE